MPQQPSHNHVYAIDPLLNWLSALLGFTVSMELLIAAIALVLGAGYIVAFLRKRNAQQRYARQRARIVRELLLNAIDQRSVLEFEFDSEAMQGRSWSGACTAIDSGIVTVDMGSGHSLHAWNGESVEVSFKLDYKDTSAYYRFSSQVIDMRVHPRGIFVDLALPAHIHPMQKRSYMRINPMPSHILGMGLWALEAAQPMPQNSTSLGSAALSYRPGRQTQCSLMNLSAGGMRMEVPLVLLNQFPTRFSLESQLLCLLLLRSPDSEQPMPFWLASTVVSLVQDMENDSNVIIGVKFKAWALSETGNCDIFWFPVGKSGEVSPIASWVLRHQLEQNKRRE
jgi:c-di-GMP-binding flagellar brake protein YcgR